MTQEIQKRRIVVIGGGTISHVRAHLALCALAYGKTARELTVLAAEKFTEAEVELYLTKMGQAGDDYPLEVCKLPNFHVASKFKNYANLQTNEDIAELVEELREDPAVKVVFFNPALVDFDGKIDDIASGKYASRLKTSEGSQLMELTPSPKLLKRIREGRKDITLVAFKTTAGASEDEQYLAGLELMKKNSVNLVLANDLVTRVNMIITPEEARYHVTTDRAEALKQLVDMAWYRCQLTFTRSTVVDGSPVPWESPEVFPSLRKVVDFCIQQNAYKPFGNATVGHFACKIGEKTFLTSIRKSNFNDLAKKGLVKVEVDGNDSVIAYGAKPSVGGQSQRIIFSEHSEYDCIVHFHCPKKPESKVPVVSQREYECGSHQCGQNTSNGLQKFGNLSAVMLDNHGPNIVFNHTIDPQEVIDFITENFDLSAKTGGLVSLKQSANA
jgi:hypothetical protein